MFTKSKKVVTILLVLAMLFGMAPMPVSGAGGEEAPSIEVALAKITSHFKGQTYASKRIVFAYSHDENEYQKEKKEIYDFVKLGQGPGEFDNVFDYIKAKASELTGFEAEDINITANSTILPGTVGSGTILQQKTMDEFGYLTPQYSDTYTTPGLMLVKISLGDDPRIADIGTVYFAVQPKSASNEEKLALESSLITWDKVKGSNTDPSYITGKLGGNISAGPLSITPALFKDSVEITWSLEYTGGEDQDPKALELNANRTFNYLRPNVGKAEAAYRLSANLKTKAVSEGESEEKFVDFDLFVKPFAGYKVPFKVYPEDAQVTVKDGYYGTNVAQDYIVSSGNSHNFTLHGSPTDGKQAYNYQVEREGYITGKGSVSVDGKDLEETVVSLIKSSEKDVKLANLSLTSPALGEASILEPMEAFDADKAEYNLKVGPIPSVTIKPEVMLEGASFSVKRHSNATNANNDTYITGTSGLCYLKTNGEPTRVVVTVTAPEGSNLESKTREYTINIIRDDTIYPLSGLTITPIGGSKNNSGKPEEEKLSPNLTLAGYADQYTYYVNNLRESITIRPTATVGENVKEIWVGDELISTGETSKEIALAVGPNEIQVKVAYGDNLEKTYNLLVYRKSNLSIKSVDVEYGGLLERSGDWIIKNYFAHEEDQVTFSLDIPDDSFATISPSETRYKKGDIISLPVPSANTMTTIHISKEKKEDDGETWQESQGYVVSFYRRGSYYPDKVESYLPAPGQFVNQPSYRFPDQTLSSGSSSMVTLGSYGGSIVYKFDEPIQNDPKNPYGIDFIVHGNAFTNEDGSNSSGAAEPAAVMVSQDGSTWYELAGSLYYDALTRHNVSVTYSNPDTSFTGSEDVAWEDSDGKIGFVYQNPTHKQAYYPDPQHYSQYNGGVGKNATFTAEYMTVFGGSLMAQKYSPRYGYGDTHASKGERNEASNPYVQEHNKFFNGDGLDLAWAVDSSGNPVSLDKISYVKIYNPILYDGGTTGEVSPEIVAVNRAKPGPNIVGKSSGLSGLLVNGEQVDITGESFEIDVKDADILQFTPFALDENSNILVNDHWISSGNTSGRILAGDKVRIILQEGEKEPFIYTISIKNSESNKSNTDLDTLTILPGNIIATPHASLEDTFAATLLAESRNIRLQVLPLNQNARVTVNGVAVAEDQDWLSGILEITDESAEVKIKVTSEDGTKEKTYTLIINKQAKAEDNTISVSFSLIGDTRHYIDENNKGLHRPQSWIGKTTVRVAENSTVKDLTDMMLIKEGLDFQTASGGEYISKIQIPGTRDYLGEFDNGPLSGWIYWMNGQVASQGYSARVLKNGDEIKWVYTDDYTENSQDQVEGEIEEEEEDDEFDDKELGELLGKFTDVKKENWFYKSVAFAVGSGLFKGTSEKQFSPESEMTRAMIVTVLHRLEKMLSDEAEGVGVGKSTEKSGLFADVDAGKWYAEAITWATSKDIIQGYGNQTFGTDDRVTREQIAVILYRYAGQNGYDFSITADLKVYQDQEEISDWAREALAWAFGNNLIVGRSATKLAPTSGATRAEVATIFERFYRMLNVVY